LFYNIDYNEIYYWGGKDAISIITEFCYYYIKILFYYYSKGIFSIEFNFCGIYIYDFKLGLFINS
jgi:hypothetical protein